MVYKGKALFEKYNKREDLVDNIKNGKVNFKKMSRRDFLKLICGTGGAIMLSPLMKLGRVLGANVTSTNTTDMLNTDSKVGLDGVSFLFPTKPGGFVWYLDTDNPIDSHFEKGGGSTYEKVVKNNDGSLKPNSDGKIKFNILVTPGQKDAIGGCKMNFADCIHRGFTRQPAITNVELTGFFKMSQAVTRDGIYMRGPWNHHPLSTGRVCCQEAGYDLEIMPNGTFKFTKDLHGAITHPQGIQTISPRVNFVGLGWFGLKYIFFIESADPASPKIRLQLWLSRNGDRETWIKVGEASDFKGLNWGEPRALCGGEPFQVYAWGAAGMVIKWFNGHIDFKWWSVREIDPPVRTY